MYLASRLSQAHSRAGSSQPLLTRIAARQWASAPQRRAAGVAARPRRSMPRAPPRARDNLAGVRRLPTAWTRMRSPRRARPRQTWRCISNPKRTGINERSVTRTHLSSFFSFFYFSRCESYFSSGKTVSVSVVVVRASNSSCFSRTTIGSCPSHHLLRELLLP